MNRARDGVALPSLAAGAALTLSLPPFGWWPSAFVGAALLFWCLRGRRARTRCWAGWLAGLACFVPALLWAHAFTLFGAAALMAGEALFFAAAATLVPATGPWRPAAFVGAFTLAEALRQAWPFGGLPIGGVFVGQADGPLLGAARLGGPLLLTALVWLGGAGLVLAVGAARRRRGWAAGAAALGLVLVVGLAGALAPDGGPGRGQMAVAAVQGGGARGYTGQDADPSVVFAAQLRASTAVPAGTRLVVWPEDVIALGRPLAGSPQAALMAGLARHLGATVVAGVTVTQDGGRFFNQAVAWGPTGRVVGTYEKVHRVPFGEYVPWRGLFSHLVSLSGVPDDAVPGHGSGLLDTPAGPLGLMVSYEVFYADRGRSATRAGAELLVVPTNTASYASSQVPTEEVAADRVQAVAEGRDLVQAATTGFSTVVDHRGRVLERSTLGAPAVVAATVALRNGATLYERAGDLPVLVLAALALAGSWVAERRRRRGPDEDPAAESPGTVQEPAVSVGQPA